MIIRTSTTIKASPETIWPLLTNSKMTEAGCFCFGVPKPVECRMEEVGDVDAKRQCVSDRGIVDQKITEWNPPQALRFEMQNTDHSWSPFVESIEEGFEPERTESGTKIVRQTTLIAKGPFRLFKELAFYAGLKRVHFFVFRNWRAQAE